MKQLTSNNNDLVVKYRSALMQHPDSISNKVPYDALTGATNALNALLYVMGDVEALRCVKKMLSGYPNYKEDREYSKTMSELFCQLPPDVVQSSIKEVCLKSKFVPTVADIFEVASKKIDERKHMLMIANKMRLMHEDGRTSYDIKNNISKEKRKKIDAHKARYSKWCDENPQYDNEPAHDYWDRYFKGRAK